MPSLTTAWRKPSVIPGFGITLGLTLLWLGTIVLLPLAALVLKATTLGVFGFFEAIATPRVMAALRLSFGLSLAAAAINLVFGLLIAWVLVRYEFPLRRLVSALVDIPFALPTAVAGISLTSIYAPNGIIGSLLEPMGLKVAFTPLGILVALVFIGIPFVVRTVEPVLERPRHRGGGGGPLPGGREATELHEDHPPDALSGAGNRFRPGLRTCGRRVRIGHLHRRQPAACVGDRSACSSS